MRRQKVELMRIYAPDGRIYEVTSKAEIEAACAQIKLALARKLAA